MNITELTKQICEALSKNKAEDIVILNVEGATILTDRYVICTGKSTTMVKALADNLEDAMTKLTIEPIHRDGIKEGQWAVLDYDSVIVHIFLPETRRLYGLEKIWGTPENTENYKD